MMILTAMRGGCKEEIRDVKADSIDLNVHATIYHLPLKEIETSGFATSDLKDG